MPMTVDTHWGPKPPSKRVSVLLKLPVCADEVLVELSGRYPPDIRKIGRHVVRNLVTFLGQHPHRTFGACILDLIGMHKERTSHVMTVEQRCDFVGSRRGRIVDR